jgi:hypothetical protein
LPASLLCCLLRNNRPYGPRTQATNSLTCSAFYNEDSLGGRFKAFRSKLVRIPILLLACLTISLSAVAQDQPTTSAPAPSHHKVLTPEQQEYQKQFQVFLKQRQALQAEAQKAYTDEMGREKNDPCNAEASTLGAEECLSRESKLTDADYTAFTKAIRAILALKAPQIGPANVPGPTGTPLTSEEFVKEFDKLESAWQQYRDLVPGTAYDQYKGGTLAPVFDGECSQQVVRSHMRELNQIYGGAIRL